ncbi:MAG TPA: heparinase II/III family protein [Rhizomicrobium sp.]|nr:heparinase II/III family protein [Rhizomicrobium sp.]
MTDAGDLSLGVTGAQVRAYCRARPLPSFEILETSSRDHALGLREIAESTITTGYGRDGFLIPSIFPPLDWSAHNRSFSYHLHAWDAIADPMIAYSLWGDRRFIEASLAHIRAWIDLFQVPILERHGIEELDALVTPHMPTEWYDMAVGRRVYRLAYVMDFLAHEPDSSDTELALFWRVLRFHLKLLGREHFFRQHTNHGLYQALGHLAAARRLIGLPGMAEELEIARLRVIAVLDAHFAADGAHKEHSPGYHFMLLGTILNARRSGLLDGKEIEDRLDAAQNALIWMVKPDLCLATFGDTDPRYLERGERIAVLYQNESLRYIISAGSMGEAPELGVKAFPEGGYAFARLHARDATDTTPWRASYIAQIAGFHSRVHKHADHLSFVWYDRARDILIDPGRYAYAGRTAPGSALFEEGFWYADPRRIYVETTRAHNCVEIDERNYKRKGIKPFGSALRYAGEQDGLAVTDCQATYFRTIRHWRGLILEPGEYLIVLDHLHDRLGAEHAFRQWFQLATSWRARETPEGLMAHSVAIGEPQTLRVTSLVPEAKIETLARAQKKPELLGWMSDAPYQLQPATSFCLRRDGATTSFATLFSFGSAPKVHETATRFNATMTAGSLRWRSNGKSVHLKFARGSDAPLAVTRIAT